MVKSNENLLSTFIRRLFGIVMFMFVGLTTYGQTTVVGWDVSGQTAYGTSPMTATTTTTNITVSTGLTRGTGVGTSGSPAGRAWGGVNWASTSQANAISGNQFATFAFKANSGYKVSLSAFNLSYRRSGTGPTNGMLQYSLDGSSFTDISTLSYSSSGATLSAISLSGITALQNVPSATTITFRIVNWGGSSAAGTWYVFDVANSTSPDLSITGTVESACSTPTAYDMFGGGSYCPESPGVSIGVANSQSGVNYQLYNGSTVVGTPAAGSGGSFSFGVYTATGTYSVLATSSLAGCGSFTTAMTTTTTVSIRTTPTVTVTPAGGSICEGGSGLAMTASGALTYTWTPTSGLSASTGATVTATPTVTSTYTVTARSSEGCLSAPVSAVVTVNSLPSPTISGTTTIASGGSAVLTFSGNADDTVYYWNGSTTNSVVIGGTGTATVSVSPTVTTTYSITSATSSLGCSATITGASATVTVSTSPTASISGGTTICPGASTVLTFSGTAGATVYYSANHGSTLSVTISGSSGVGTATVSVTPTVTTVYRLDSISSGLFDGLLADSVTVTISTLPTSYSITGGGSYCAGGSGLAIGLSSSDTGVSYQLYNGSSTIGSSVSGIGSSLSFGTYTAIGTYSVLATNTYGCSTSMTGTANIAINTLPNIVVISSDTSVCAGSNLTLSTTISGTALPFVYTWSGPSSFYSSLSTSSLTNTTTVTSIPASPTSPVYTVLVTDANGCVATGINTVSTTVLPITAGTISGTASVLVGLSTALTSSVSGGVWSSAATAVATVGSSTGIVTGVSNGTATISYQVTTGCGIATATRIVTVSTPSATSISGTQWSGFTGSSAAGASAFPSVPAASVPGGAVVNVSQWNRGAGAASSTASSTYNSNGFNSTTLSSAQSADDYLYFSITNNSSTETRMTALNLATQTSSTGPTNFQLFYNRGSGADVPFDVAKSNPSNATFSLNFSDAVCIPPSQTFTFKLYAWGASSSAGTFRVNNGTGITATYVTGVSTPSITASSTSPVCAGASLGLIATPSGGSSSFNYSWSGPSGFASTVQHPTITAVSGVYTVVLTDLMGCADTATTSVSTLYVTSLPSISGTTSICLGNVSTLVNDTTGGMWSSNNTGVATVGSISGIVTGISAGTSMLTYTFTNHLGCTSVVTTTVTVNPLPIVDSIGGTLSLCAGGTTTLTDTTTGGVWSSSNTAVATIGTSGVVSGITAGTTTITYTKTNSFGCTDYVTAVVTVNPLPIVGSIGGTLSLCAGGTTTLTDTTTGGVWNSSNTAVATIGTSGVVSGVSEGTTTITYTKTNSFGCTDYVTAVVTVNPLPIVGSIGGILSLCTGGTTTLTDTTTGGVWSSSNTAVATIGTSGVVSGVTAGTTTITYTKTNSFGCTDYVTAMVTVNPLPIVGSIVGTLSLCAGGTTTLTDTTTGGVWSSSNTAVATIGTSGVVSGISAGTTIITYSKTNSFGCADYVIAMVTVNPLPIVGSIGGTLSLCAGGTTTLTDTTTGGVWSSSNTAVATIGTSGVVSGVSAGTTTISYTKTNSFGCTDYVTAIMTVNPLPIVGSISGTLSLCAGGTTTLTDTTTSGVWSSSNTAVATIGTSGIVSGISAGTTIITYSKTNSFGCADYVTAIVTVNPLPIVGSIGGTLSLCAGGTTTLTDTTTGGVWSSSNTAVATIGTSGIVSGLTAGTTTITYANTNSFSCTNYVTAVVTVNPLPIVGSIGGTLSLCAGGTTTLTDTTTGGVWSSSNTAVATIGTSGVVSGVSAGTTTITYTKTNSFSCTNYVTAVVTVNPLPIVGSIGGTLSLCAGGTTTLTDTTTGGEWSSSNTTVATIGTSGVVSGVSAGTTIITYTKTNSFGCTDYVTAVVTVNPLPIVGSIGGTLSLCAGDTTTLTDTTTGGEWSSSNTTVATIGTSGVVSGVSAGTTIITYTKTNSFGCTDYVTAIVTINPLPIVGSIGGTLSICAGGTTTLTDTTTGGVWSSSNTAVATIGTSGVVSGVSAGTTTISFTKTNSFGCTDYVTAVVTVNPLPIVGSIGGTLSLCTGGTTTLTDTTTGGVWSSGNTAVATIGTSGLVSGVSAGTTTITYTKTNSFGCADYVTAVVTVNPLPIVGSIGGTLSLCAGGTITLTDTTTGGVWSSSNTAVATIGTSGVVSGVSAGTTTITYTKTNSFGCTDYVTVVVTVNPLPIVGSIGGPLSLCAGGTTTLTDTTTGGVWSSSNTAVATIGTSGIVSGMSAGTTTISYTKTNSFGCTDYVTAIVTVNPLPIVSSISGTLSLCAGGTTTLTDTTTGGVWSSSNTAVANIGTSGVVSGVSAGTTTITYTKTSSFGCTDYVTVIVTVNPLPTAISITGPASLCIGTAQSYIPSITGGTWVSSNLSIATIGSSTGVVTPVTTGTTRITYHYANEFGCTTIATLVVTINNTPATPSIVGAYSACVGANTTLSASVSGGTWSSSNPTVGTIAASSGIFTALTSGTSIITYTITNSSGCIANATTIVSVNLLPDLTVSSGSTSVCTGQSVMLSASISGGTWSSSNTSRATVDTNGMVTGVASGTVNIIYTLPTGCLRSQTITVNATPSAITGTATICVGATSTLSSVTGGSIGWSSSNSAVATIGSTSGTVSGVSAGTAIVTYSIFTGCYTTRIVTINETPSITTMPSTICLGTTATLTATPAGGNWQSSSVTVATIGSTSGVINSVSGGSTIVSYTLSTGCRATTAVTIGNLPGAITGNSTLCVGGTATFTSATSGFTWSAADVSVAIINPTTGFLTATGVGNTTITYTHPSGCYRTATVTVNALPASISGLTSICVSSTAMLSSATSGGTWSSSNNAIATVGSAGLLTGISSGSATVSYTLAGVGCRVTQLVSVAAPLPAISGATLLCIGATSALSNTVTGGTWSTSSSSIATIGSTTGIVSAISTGTTIVTYTSASGCNRTIIITVNSTPTSIVGGTATCEGGATTLTSSPSGGTWSSSNIAVATVGSASGVLTSISAGTTVITYARAGVGCFTTQTITINSAIPAIVGPTNLCVADSVTYTHSMSGGTWSSSNMARAIVGSTTGLVTGVAPGTVTITYHLSTGCYKTFALTVTQLPLSIYGSTSVCEGSTTLLVSGSTGGAWYTTDTTVASINMASGLTTGITSGTARISYTVVGCTTTRIVTVQSLPATISGLLYTCVGSSTSLTSVTAGGTWNSSSSAIASVGSASGIVSGISAGTTRVSYISSNGCFRLVTVTVNALPPAILGVASVCIGNSTTLTNSVSGGSWVSANTAVATINAVTGVLTGVAPGTAIISYVLSTGCVQTRIATVNALPSVPVGDSVVCVGTSIMLTAGVSGGTYTSSNSGIATVHASLGTVTGISAGAVNITYTNGTSCFVTKTITVNAFLSPITGPSSVCIGQTISLTHAISGGTWTSSNTSRATIDGATGIVTGILNGTTTISYTLSSGCFVSRVLTVNVMPGSIAGSSALCIGSSSTYSISSGAGGTWSTSSSSIATVGSTTGIVSALSYGAFTLTYTMNTGCTVTRSIFVDSLPAAISGVTSICAGSTTALSSMPAGGIWSSSSSYVATVDSTGLLSANNSGNATITYTNTTGCRSTLAVTVLALPTTIAGATSLCVGNTISLSSAPAGGSWSSSNTSVLDFLSGGNVVGVSTGSALVSYTGTNGCVRTQLLTVNESLSPIVGDSAVCVFGSVLFSNTTTGGTWSTSAPGIAVVGGTSGIVTGLSFGSATISYRVGIGCVATKVIAVGATLPAISGTASVSVGGTTLLSISTSGGTWVSSDNDIATLLGTTGTVSGVSVGTATISYVKTGCVRTRLVTVNPSTVSRPSSTYIDREAMMVYPNPTSNFLYIDATANGSCKLYSLNGKQILSSPLLIGKNIFDLQVYSLANGAYQLLITSEAGDTISKMIFYQR